ncbi:MAG: SurA N-terminal domain-containing protein [Gammaproteobacteria bacterium]|nr:SurA N-terminal domain-containing protein [Gammaproteobacteria bacterium]
MIQVIRDHAQGVFAWIIIVLVTIPFALWGVNEYFQGGGELPIAEVGKRPISSQEFQQVYQRELGMRRQILGDDFIVQNEAAIKRAVLEGLVNSEVMLQTVRKAGFRVDDARVGNEIRAISQFQRDGKFDPELYERMLRGAGLAREQFEDSVRRDLLTTQLTSGVTDTVLVSESELDRWLRLSEQRRKIGYYQVKAEAYEGRVVPSEAEVNKYYQDNLERFAVPERVKVEYLELSRDSLMKGLKADDDTLRRLYEEQAASFTVGEERRARHILIKAADGSGEDADAARTRAEELRARIVAGESFVALAREFSADKGSAQEGGELGFFGRGVMVGPFEDTVCAMKKGEISAPVRTPFGWHIIELEDIKAGAKRSFSEVRASLEEEYRKTQVEAQMFDLTENLTNLTYEHPETLKFASEQLGLSIQTTDLFSRDQGDGVAANENFRLAAFGEDVIDGGNNSEAIQLDDGRVVVLRIAEKQPATHRTLDELRDPIRLELVYQGAQRLAEEAGKDMRKRLEGGDGVDALLKEFPAASWHAPVLSGREDADVPAEVLDAVFAMARPSQDRPAIEGISLGGGDYAVIALYEVVDGDPKTVTDSERNAQRGELQRRYAQRDSADLTAFLRGRAKVSLFEGRL